MNHTVSKIQIAAGLLALLLLSSMAQAWPVKISGVEGAVRENITEARAIQRLLDLKEPDADFVERLAAQAAAEAKRAIEPFGYYNPTVTNQIKTENGAFELLMDVAAGPVTLVDSVNLTFMHHGETQPAPENVAFAMNSGAPFVHSDYNSAKRDAQIALLEQGYLDAQLVDHRALVRRKDNRVAIHLAWELGPQYRFGDIRFSGSELKTPLLMRYVDFEAGEAYRQSALAQLNRSLLESGYFDDVSLDVKKLESHSVNIEVNLTPRARSVYEIGAAFGTDTGPGIEATNERRRINSRGHTAVIEASVNQRRLEGEVTYGIPRKANADSLVNLTLGYVDEDTDTSDRQTIRFGAQRLGIWKGWRRTDGISLLREEFDVASVKDTSSLLMPSISLSKSNHDGSLIPSEGWYLRLGVTSALKGLISDLSLVQMNVDYRWIRSLSENDRLLSRVRLGSTWTSDFSELPVSLRYFAGGDRSIRGYDFESLGPVDADGEVEGGKHLLLGSVEYERRLRGPWRMALFVDGGNAINALDDDLEFGAGLGVRYETPVGLIRLDLASPISGDGELRLHFSLGPDL